MRFFGICCYFIAVFYGYTAVEAMRTGVATPLRGGSTALHRSDDPASAYKKLLISRWLLAVGFAALGAVMQTTASRLDQLNQTPPRK
jgi:hypothetical protein